MALSVTRARIAASGPLALPGALPCGVRTFLQALPFRESPSDRPARSLRHIIAHCVTRWETARPEGRCVDADLDFLGRRSLATALLSRLCLVDAVFDRAAFAPLAGFLSSGFFDVWTAGRAIASLPSSSASNSSSFRVRHAKRLGLFEFRAWIGAHDDVIGVLADRTHHFSAVRNHRFAGLLARAARQRSGEDKRSGRPGGSRPAPACSCFGSTPAARRRSITFRLARSEKNSAMLAATLGPTSATSVSACSSASASALMEPKCSASNCAVRSPTKRMPSA